jgi:hypothetical protein
MDTLLRTLETLLTSVIAGAGIPTAIAAIWAARVARRQAKLTERSLTEQHERLRLNLEVDLLHRMLDRYNSQYFLGKRSAVARHFLDNAFVDDDIVEVDCLNEAALAVCTFFGTLAYYQSIGALPAKAEGTAFGEDVRGYWSLCKPGIEKLREELQDPTLYEGFEQLSRLMADMNRERGIPPYLKPELLRRFMEAEAGIGEEPPTTTTQ